MTLTKNQQIGIGVGVVAAVGVYFVFVKKDPMGLTAWARMTGHGPSVGKPKLNSNEVAAANPASETAPSYNTTGKVPRSTQGYWKNGSWYHY